jgi:hypothetical protein
MDHPGIKIHFPVRNALRNGRHAEGSPFTGHHSQWFQAVQYQVVPGNIPANGFHRNGFQLIVQRHLRFEIRYSLRVFGINEQPHSPAELIAETGGIQPVPEFPRRKATLAGSGIDADRSAGYQRGAAAPVNINRSLFPVEQDAEEIVLYHGLFIHLQEYFIRAGVSNRHGCAQQGSALYKIPPFDRVSHFDFGIEGSARLMILIFIYQNYCYYNRHKPGILSLAFGFRYDIFGPDHSGVRFNIP